MVINNNLCFQETHKVMRYIKLLWFDQVLLRVRYSLQLEEKWEEEIILGRWTILQEKYKVEKELDAFEKLNESQCAWTRQVKRDEQAHVGDIGLESKYTEL